MNNVSETLQKIERELIICRGITQEDIEKYVFLSLSICKKGYGNGIMPDKINIH